MRSSRQPFRAAAVALLAAACGGEAGGHSGSPASSLDDLEQSAVGPALEDHGVKVCHAYEDPDPDNAFPLSEQARVMLVGAAGCDDAAEREVVVGRFRSGARRDESLRRLSAAEDFWLVGFSYGTNSAVAVSRRNPPSVVTAVESAVRRLGGTITFDHRHG